MCRPHSVLACRLTCPVAPGFEREVLFGSLSDVVEDGGSSILAGGRAGALPGLGAPTG